MVAYPMQLLNTIRAEYIEAIEGAAILLAGKFLDAVR